MAITPSKKTLSKKEALHKAAALCSRGEQAPCDISEKLVRWGISPTDVAEILDHLIRENFLNEKRYCRSFALDKLRYNGWGRVKIGYALRQKGVNRDLIAESLATIDETEYIHRLSAILRTKTKGAISNLSHLEKEKVIRFALSRGFEYETIARLLKTDRNIFEE